MQGLLRAFYPLDIDSTGTKLISYTYYAWGNFTVSYHNGANANSVALKNPFLYRGYYYDQELGLYYLQSRYYDSNTGRFINPDSSDVIAATAMGLTDKNLMGYGLKTLKSEKGFMKTAKYYFSQTYNMFYDKALKDGAIGIIKKTAFDTAEEYTKSSFGW